MNTIPSIGPDAAVAPRTGSGSPQTPSQQRADAAPTVIADSAGASADPGVLLKVTPPVQPRQGDSAVMGQAGGLPATEALAMALAKDLAAPIDASGEQADLAIAKRISDAFAALPVEVQEAIKQASSPAIAHLLRLAAMTAPGIREAPAHILSSHAPMAEEPGQAATNLHETLQRAAPFQLARILREALLTQSGPEGAQARLLWQQLSAMRAASAPQAAITQAPAQGMGAALELLFDAAGLGPSASFETIAPQGASAALSKAQVAQAAQELATPAMAARSDTLAARSADSAQTVAANPSQQATPSAQAAPSLQAAPNPQLMALLTPQQGEQALRDGLKILMDGRMLWHGHFTPGVPMAMERSDAWRDDRDAVGGMEKGTSLRFRLSLPQLGEVEVRAVGFGGQVSARVHVHPGLASTMAQALPALHTRLRDRGLAGAQVAVESH